MTNPPPTPEDCPSGYPPAPLSPTGRADPRPTAELELDARVEAGPDRYRFGTAAGVVSANEFRPAELRLLEGLWGTGVDDLLVVEANYGVVGTVLGAQARVHMTESRARAAGLCRHNATHNGTAASGDGPGATVSIVPECTALDRRFGTAAYAPKPYTPVPVGKRRLANALSVLEPGGQLYLAAAKEAGLSRYADTLADLATDLKRGRRRDGVRLLKATRPATLDPPACVESRTLEPTVEGVRLSLRTVPGLFSPTRLDAGTRLLLETATVADGQRVLDLCCGYGAVGTWAALAADSEVLLTDDDAVAAACARWSLRASGADGEVVVGDGTAAVEGPFDAVLSNPPTHAGDEVLANLFDGARDVLASGGRFTLVHHRDLDLSAHLAPFDAIERRATGEEHVVLTARP